MGKILGPILRMTAGSVESIITPIREAEPVACLNQDFMAMEAHQAETQSNVWKCRQK